MERLRSTNSFKISTSYFPDYKHLFVNNNQDVPAGLYFKNGNAWVGYSNYSFIPSDTDQDAFTRKTVHSKIYELRESEGNKVWTNPLDFYPMYFFDNFKVPDSGTIQLPSEGYKDDNIKLNIQDVIKKNHASLHYVALDKESYVKGHTLINIGTKPVSISALVQNISRTYPNGEVIDINEFASIFSFKSRTSSINIGLCYDKSLNLYFYDQLKRTPVQGVTLSSTHTYQIALKFFKQKAWVLVDNTQYGPFDITNDTFNLEYYFAVGNDLNYAKYQNGSFEFAELSLFDFLITEDEHIWLKKYPRSWNFNQFYSPVIDLNFDQKQALKNNLNIFLKQEEALKNMSQLLTGKLDEYQNQLKEKISKDVEQLLAGLLEKQKNIEKLKSQLEETIKSLSGKISVEEFQRTVEELQKMRTLKDEALAEVQKILEKIQAKIDEQLSNKLTSNVKNTSDDLKRNFHYHFDSDYSYIDLNPDNKTTKVETVSHLMIPLKSSNGLKYKVAGKEIQVWDHSTFDPNLYILKENISHDFASKNENHIASIKALQNLQQVIQTQIALITGNGSKINDLLQSITFKLEAQIKMLDEKKADKFTSSSSLDSSSETTVANSNAVFKVMNFFKNFKQEITDLVNKKQDKISAKTGFNLEKSDATDLSDTNVLATSKAVADVAKNNEDQINRLRLKEVVLYTGNNHSISFSQNLNDFLFVSVTMKYLNGTFSAMIPTSVLLKEGHHWEARGGEDADRDYGSQMTATSNSMKCDYERRWAIIKVIGYKIG